jgi:hypothetical protein
MYMPEYIKSDEFGDNTVPPSARPQNTIFYYLQPSQWQDLGNGSWKMTQDYPGYIKFEIVFTPGQNAIYFAMRVFNYRSTPITNVTSDFDTSCKETLLASGWTVGNPDWYTTLVFQQAHMFSEAGGWQAYPNGGTGSTPTKILACQNLNTTQVVALAMENPGQGTHASAHTCIHTIGQLSASLAPNTWSPWQHRAVYVISGSLNDVSNRYHQEFVMGGANDKWP